ncbi:hypothetical protein F0562_034202 [Nyssa sinensis]|uniref:Uncharacterized protein n=1 Tax=Nyssa sinensis TaxID=561372 RepID=A0A5J5AHS7_9ASTE|nr:hypothetical protein F0562_034202 [Nyssa sinensis]
MKMTSDIYVQSELCNDEKSSEGTGFNLNLSAMACYSSNWFSSFSDEAKNRKRLRQSQDADESVASNGTHYCYSTVNNGGGGGGGGGGKGSTNSLPRLHFRDHIWAYTQRYLAVEAMEEAATALMNDKGDEVKEDGSGEGMRLVQQLIACAEAVACRDKAHASALLSELRTDALVFGTSFQRVASCFVQGLSDRLAVVQPLGAVRVVGQMLKTMAFTTEKEEALSLVYEICPQIQFGHFVANALMLEAFEGESSVHVVDLGMTLGLRHGHQWRKLMESLVKREDHCQPLCRLHITGVGNCAERLQVIGDELEQYADSLGLNFEFSVVESNLENLQSKDFKILEGEDSNHNGPFFLGRFMEALHYYSAIFDSLDAMLPKYDTRRAKMEQFYFAEEIKNIVSCEGPARVERHEKIDQWRRRMSRAGFQPSPIKMITQANQWLGKAKVCEGYTVVEEKGCLVLGWKSKPINAASCWKCSSI